MITARPSFSYIKVIIIWTLVLTIGVGAYFAYTIWGVPTATVTNIETPGENETVEKEPLTDEVGEDVDFAGVDVSNAIDSRAEEIAALSKQKEPHKPEDKTKNFNILVLGIDRRHGNQSNWRTDVIQLVTLSPDRSKAVITHIPRDVWAGSYKINAIYNLQGPDAIKDQVEQITGQRPDRIIRVDFDAFVYAVDMAGGVTINNPTEFTDESYPNDRAGSEEAIKISFPKGEQVLDGEEALQYVRSRKGTNGEGSDYARGRRQQVVMRSILADYFKPSNMFKPKTAEALYNIATQKVYTDISIQDTKVLYDLLVNYKSVSIKTLGLDTSNYLTVPSDRSAYGGQWTLVAKTDYKEVHEVINGHLK